MALSTNTDWRYGVLEDAVTKGSSNISHGKIKEDDGPYPVFGAKGYIQNISFYQQENDYIAIIKDGAGIGRVSVHPAKSSVLATMQYLLPKEGFDLRFIKYFLESLDFEEYRTGSTIPHIYFKDYKSAPFPLISVPEQKRIVAILDQAFADIEQARAKTEQNLKNARELFESYLQQVFSQRGEGWGFYKLSELCNLISGQHIDAKNYNNEQRGIGYLTGPSDFGVINPTVTKWTEHPKRTAIKGDILITVKGSGVGKVNIMSAGELAISRQLMAVRPTNAVGDLLYWFLSMQFDYFQSLANGAAIPGISRHDVLDLKLSIPLSGDQQELVDRISQFNLETVDLERIYTDKLSSLDELKKSILQKAFSGELTKTLEVDTNKGAVA
ncbi:MULTISPECIES: restriction endonuclease subunit S [Pseudoalteromonas]|jgi:type I restriction enzyme S subunit|uniref:restriction endonuclease subunit S n=2 Tax=Alteromonadales TaxID=135622 RepID=UPI0021752866|nr:restriction endonuclease subunit S [Pseudoalteromonas sp. 5Ae-yellow]|tara:strand:+ start:1284 stop:2435 length:1152 start_codon:yes stop_codon:yes gene_type:complete